METAITSIGIANPPYQIQQNIAAKFISELLGATGKERKLIHAIYKHTGIKHRYSVLKDASCESDKLEFFPTDNLSPFPPTSHRMQVYKDNALPLALSAIKHCLDDANPILPRDITHLITVSCTGMYAPGLDIELINALNFSPHTQRTTINFMGCYGAFNGVKVAESICRGNPNANVLVVCVELCTIHFQKKKDLDNLTSNAIFADGASCVLIQDAAKSQRNLELSEFHCDLLPQTQNEMAWHIGDSGFDMKLSSYVPEAIRSGIAHFFTKLISKLNLTLEQIDFYAIHPGATKILSACEQALGLEKKHNQFSYEVLENYGNMSSATFFFVLKSLWDNLSTADNRKTVLGCAFGPGLTLESMLLKVNYV